MDYNAAGQPDALRYEKMVLYLVEIAKRQKAQNEELKARVEKLEELIHKGGTK